MKFRELSQQEFNQFALSNKYNNFLQSIDAYRLSQLRNEDSFFLGVIDEGVVVAATYGVRVLLLKKYYKYFFPGGFLMDYTNQPLVQYFITSLKAYTKEKGALYCRFTPNVIYEYYENEQTPILQSEGVACYQHLLQNGCLHNGFLKGFDVEETSRFQYHLSLDQELKTIRKNYRQNTRNKISAAKRYQTKIRFGTKEDLPAFYEIYKETSQRQGFKVIKSLDFFNKYYDAFTQEDHLKLVFAEVDLDEYTAWLEKEMKQLRVKLERYADKANSLNAAKEVQITLDSYSKKMVEAKQLEAKYGNKIISATSLFVTYGHEVVYFDSGSYDDLLNLAGQYLIQDTMIEYAKEHGYQTYNFLGFSGDFENDGVYLFKKGFNGHVVTTVGQFDLPVRPLLYRAYFTAQKMKAKLRK